MQVYRTTSQLPILLMQFLNKKRWLCNMARSVHFRKCKMLPGRSNNTWQHLVMCVCVFVCVRILKTSILLKIKTTMQNAKLQKAKICLSCRCATAANFVCSIIDKCRTLIRPLKQILPQLNFLFVSCSNYAGTLNCNFIRQTHVRIFSNEIRLC